MKNLCKELCNIIEDRDDLTFSKVATYIGASKQAMSKFKNEGVIGFRKILRLSYLLFPDTQKEVMSQWCLRFNTVEMIKRSFEYAAITRNLELLETLLDMHKHERSGGVSECVAIYSLIYDYMTEKVHGNELSAKLENACRLKDENLRLLVDIFKCYSYYFQKKFRLMVDVAQEIERKLRFLSDKRELFIKECFLHRIAEILAPAYLHLNNLKLARHYANIIINANICAKAVSDSYYIVGMSYMLEDNDKCIDYLTQSYDISKSASDAKIEKYARLNLDFAKLNLNVKLDPDSDKTLLNFQENKSEINIKALEEALYQSGNEDELIVFKAKTDASKEKLHECFIKFFKQSNFFCSSIIAKELMALGDDSIWVKQMIEFTINEEESVCFEKDFINCFSSFGNSNTWRICG
jgi:curved DNA-binding protein CbpA